LGFWLGLGLRPTFGLSGTCWATGRASRLAGSEGAVTDPLEVQALFDVKVKKRVSLGRQIDELNGDIGYWAYMYQWQVNLGEITVEEALDRLGPRKAARNTLMRLLEKRRR
jgi:hypothetical protein